MLASLSPYKFSSISTNEMRETSHNFCHRFPCEGRSCEKHPHYG